MTTRTKNSAQTKDALLAAARLRFAEDGYERTTIRAVAAMVGVDPALVMRYFGSKDKLFAAAARLDLEMPDLTGVPADRIADHMVPVFLDAWQPGGPFLGLLRAATSNPIAADALRTVFAQQVSPALRAVARDDAPARAALLGAQLLGIAVARYILETPPLVTMSERELIRWLRPVFACYLNDPRPRLHR